MSFSPFKPDLAQLVEKDNLLLTTREAAALLRCDRKTLLALPIPFVALSKRKRRYRLGDLTKYVAGRIMVRSSQREVAPSGRRIPGKSETLGLSGTGWSYTEWKKKMALQMANSKGG